MKPHEVRELSAEELVTRIGGWEEQLFRARCNAAVGQLSNGNELRLLRREIARGKTILHEITKDALSAE